MKGEKIGGFVLERRLGRGLDGEVWKARGGDGVLAALKLFTDPIGARRFRTTGVPSTPQDPHLCRVLGADTASLLPWLATEYVEGRTLRDALAEGGKFTAASALGLLRRVVKGLAALHRGKVAHLDLRPENVVLDANGAARLTDVITEAAFRELAPRLFDTAHPHPIPAERAAGHVPYIAPELRKPAPPAPIDGIRADIYALGVLAYETLTGARPPEGGFDVPPPSRKQSGISKPLDAMILRCLERAPRQRPATVLEVETALV